MTESVPDPQPVSEGVSVSQSGLALCFLPDARSADVVQRLPELPGENYVLATCPQDAMPGWPLLKAASPAAALNDLGRISPCEWALLLCSGQHLPTQALAGLLRLLDQHDGPAVKVRIEENRTGMVRFEWLLFRPGAVRFAQTFIPTACLPVHTTAKVPAGLTILENEVFQVPEADTGLASHYACYSRLLTRRPNALQQANLIRKLKPDLLERMPLHIKKSVWYERYLSEAVHFYCSLSVIDLDMAADCLIYAYSIFPDSPNLCFLYSNFLALKGKFLESHHELVHLPERLETTAYHRLAKLEDPVYRATLNKVLLFLAQPPAAPVPADLQIVSLRQAWEQMMQPIQQLGQALRPFERFKQGTHAFGSLDYHIAAYQIQCKYFLQGDQQKLGVQVGRAEWEAGQPARARHILCRSLANIMSNTQKLKNIWDLVMAHLPGLQGNWVELGCNRGMTSLLLQLMRLHGGLTGRFHVFDSFQGLPSPGQEDGATPFDAGSCSASEQDFRYLFQFHGLPCPRVHSGWFDQTLQELPDHIALAFLDGDFYQSITQSLQGLEGHLRPGALVIVDDYFAPTLPGVKAACRDFFGDRLPIRRHRNHHEETAYYIHGF